MSYTMYLELEGNMVFFADIKISSWKERKLSQISVDPVVGFLIWVLYNFLWIPIVEHISKMIHLEIFC